MAASVPEIIDNINLNPLTTSKGAGNPKSISNWNLLREDVSLPAAVIDLDKLEHNFSWMQKFCDFYKCKLSPHGKTTMAPAIFHRQIHHGAWAITLASASQTRAAHVSGIKRILLANQLVGQENMAMISRIMCEDPDFDFMCLIDSVENVKTLGKFFQERNQSLKVLLEYGVQGGRTGVRDHDQEDAVLKELQKWPSLKLIGVEFYEGILKEERDVRHFIRKLVSKFLILLERRAFSTENVIISGSGSCWFDVVADELSFLKDLPLSSPSISHYDIDIVLRPGCYVTHGLKLYDDIEARLDQVNPIDGLPLQHSLSIWAYVQSKPEEGLIIIGMGKRDVLDDCGLPEPCAHYRPGSDPRPRDVTCKGWRLKKLMDQHSFMEVDGDSGSEIRVGDILIFRVCHPCTAFDKWRCILGTDSEFNVKEVFQTYF